MEWVDLFIRTVVAVACGVVCSACVCRLNLLKYRRHKSSWIAMFVFMGGFSMGTLLQVMGGEALTFQQGFALIAFCLYLRISMDTWRSSPPPRALKGMA